jgi:hypothetical protein
MTDRSETTPVYGLIENETLWHWLSEHDRVVNDLPRVAIAAIDSSRDLGATSVPSLGLGRVGPRCNGRSALFLSGRELVKLNEQGVLTGFDEVWIGDESKGDDSLPDVDVARLLSAIETIDRRDATALARRMEDAGFSTILGDGLGLYYFAVSQLAARSLGLPTGD